MSAAKLSPDRVDVSDSQLKAFQQCMRKWAYNKILGLDAEEDKRAMVYGDGLHNGLEVMGKGGALADMIAAMEKTYSEPEKWKHLVPEEDFALGRAHLTGFVTHFWPVWSRQWQLREAEQWFEYQPVPWVNIRGKKDNTSVSITTGGFGIFDYKASSAQYSNTLKQTLEWNVQLALYALDHRRKTGQWPDAVGLIFLMKSSKKDVRDKIKQLREDPGMYQTAIQTVTPRFAAFAIDMEKAYCAQGWLMLSYIRDYLERGPVAMDLIPPNYDSCQGWTDKCGFSSGCHAGCPAHRSLPGYPKG